MRAGSALSGIAVVLGLGGCMATRQAPEAAAPSATPRERIARLALGRVEFGSISLIPVRFEHCRISGPFEDAGRTLYCVSTHMKGRTFGKAERPKIVVQAKSAGFSVIDDDEICTGHRTEPFPELETLGNRAG